MHGRDDRNAYLYQRNPLVDAPYHLWAADGMDGLHHLRQSLIAPTRLLCCHIPKRGTVLRHGSVLYIPALAPGLLDQPWSGLIAVLGL